MGDIFEIGAREHYECLYTGLVRAEDVACSCWPGVLVGWNWSVFWAVVLAEGFLRSANCSTTSINIQVREQLHEVSLQATFDSLVSGYSRARVRGGPRGVAACGFCLWLCVCFWLVPLLLLVVPCGCPSSTPLPLGKTSLGFQLHCIEFVQHMAAVATGAHLRQNRGLLFRGPFIAVLMKFLTALATGRIPDNRSSTEKIPHSRSNTAKFATSKP